MRIKTPFHICLLQLNSNPCRNKSQIMRITNIEAGHFRTVSWRITVVPDLFVEVCWTCLARGEQISGWPLESGLCSHAAVLAIMRLGWTPAQALISCTADAQQYVAAIISLVPFIGDVGGCIPWLSISGFSGRQLGN